MDFSSVPRALTSLERRVPSTAPLVALLRNKDTTAETWLAQLPALLETTSDSTSSQWEPLAVALYCATELLQQTQALQQAKKVATEDTAIAPSQGLYVEGPRVPAAGGGGTAAASPQIDITLTSDAQIAQLANWLHTTCLTNLEHGEPRIRTLVAKAVAVYAALGDDVVNVQALQAQLIDSIRTHIAQGRDTANTTHSRDSTGALDDTTGWRALETNWQTLAALVMARQGQFLTNIDESTYTQLLLDAEYSAVTHVNRHVRAASMAWLEQCVAAVHTDWHTHAAQLTDAASPLRKCLAVVLKAGLADNWSQVRMAASVLCRALFVTVQSHTDTSDNDAKDHPLASLFPTLLPRMCLNRFYLAQGVKLYSHESWRLCMQDQGIARVVQYLPAVVRYYIQAADADNHVVREAACQGVAELATRLPAAGYSEELLAHVPTLLQALIMAFYDESWPVRDEACLATAVLAKSFPQACEAELETLWQRWSEQLNDQIWSVRQDAAVALGDALEAFPTQLWPRVQTLLAEWLPSAKNQPAMTREALKQHQNDLQAHTGSTLYSCGSLAPKLSKKAGAGRIGCSSCGVDREKAPWEATDGCLYLIRELVLRSYNHPDDEGSANVKPPPLAALGLDDAYFVPLMKTVVDICRVKHFPQADDLRATLWRQLPLMAQEAWGKERFKRKYLDIFTELLADHLDSRVASPLSKHAAGQCADALADLVGRGIFRGRLAEDWQREAFDKAMRERATMPSGPSDEFSPYGPPGLLEGVGKGPIAAIPGVSMNPGRAF